MWGAGPPATWAFAIFLASDMLFLRLFPGGFGGFAFSQCECHIHSLNPHLTSSNRPENGLRRSQASMHQADQAAGRGGEAKTLKTAHVHR